MATPLRVLIIEDSEDDAELVVRELRRAQYDVCFERVDTSECLTEALRSRPWDLVISDYSMPQFRGTDALELVKKSGLDIPFIFVSGTMGEDVAVAAMKSGAQDYLTKGKLGRLVPAVERELREAEIRRAQKRAAARVESEQERLRALHEINQAVTSTLDLRSILYVLLEAIAPLLPQVSALAIKLLNDESKVLEPVACRNIGLEEWKTEPAPSGNGIEDKLLAAKAPVAILNVQKDPQAPDRSLCRKHGLVSYVGIPLVAKEKPIGVLALYTKEEHVFSDEDIEFLTTLGSQAAVAIHNAQLYEQTKKQAAELERAYRAKAEFLSIMSHELRTPLSAVLGYTDILYNRIVGEINPEQEKLLAKIIARSNDLSTMINSILEVTRLEAGAMKIDEEPVNLVNFMRDLKGSYDTPLEKAVALEWHYAADLPTVRTDPLKLRQIIQNLINNAIKFTDRGTISISAQVVAKTGRRQLAPARRSPARPAERWVEFRVADTGIGIPPDSVPLIFEMFRQVDGSRTRSYGGVGLGLYIVKKYAELLGGEVAVQSEPGKGSTFVVSLPVHSE
ncbi:MAG TPA: ATP-binding protein [Candidatus Acidoferrales bacterium]|nr:ATP-binding protein [Candidatus Acidoferrales bacterium]